MNADSPLLWLVRSQEMTNQTVRGVRLLWKIAPAITELWHPGGGALMSANAKLPGSHAAACWAG